MPVIDCIVLLRCDFRSLHCWADAACRKAVVSDNDAGNPSCKMPTTGSACSAPARVTSGRALEAVLHVCRRNRARAAIRLFVSCHALFGSKSLWLKRQLGKDRGPAAAEYCKSRQAILERKIGITFFRRGPKFG